MSATVNLLFVLIISLIILVDTPQDRSGEHFKPKIHLALFGHLFRLTYFKLNRICARLFRLRVFQKSRSKLAEIGDRKV